MDRARKLMLQTAHAPVIIEQHRPNALRAADSKAATDAMDAHLCSVVEHSEDVLTTKPAYVREIRKEII